MDDPAIYVQSRLERFYCQWKQMDEVGGVQSQEEHQEPKD